MPRGYVGLSKRNTAITEEQKVVTEVAPIRQGTYGALRLVGNAAPAEGLALLRQISLSFDEKHAGYLRCKRVIDVLGASFAIVFLSPLILCILVGACFSGGSPFFRHRRVGMHGEPFDVYKFRTMVRNADAVLQHLLDSDRTIKEEWLRDHKLRDDPRITRLGRFLRRTSLDELPQLLNVLRGEMSLVGPRPVVPEELARYGQKVGVFLSAKPGITGLWQVSGRNDTDYRRRVALDVCYVKARRLSLDISILFLTFPAVFAKNGAY